MSLASRAKAEAVQELTKSLNWTYITTLSLSNIRASAEEQLFANLVSDDICLTGRHVVGELRDVTQALASSTSHGIVLFTGDLDLSFTSSFTLPDQSSLIIVSKDFNGLQTQLRYIRFASKLRTLQGFGDYLSTVNENNVIQWILDTRFFQNICVVSGGNPYLLVRSCIPSQSGSGSLAISDAVTIMGESLKDAIETSCADFDVLSCPAVSMALTTMSTRNMTQFSQRSGDHERLLVEKDTEVEMKAYTPWPISFTEIQTQHGRLELPSTLPGTFYNSHCQGFCYECSMCKPPLTSSERVVLQEGTVYIVGVFPIHTTSSGMTCADPNIPGFQAAQAFTSAVDQLNSTGLTRDLPPGITIGWAMFDSCGDPGWFERKKDEIESCMYNYKDANEKSVSIQPTRTIAYVNLANPDSFKESSKLLATVSSLGVGLNGDSIRMYADYVMATLVKLKWVYTSIVYSDDELSVNVLGHMKKSGSRDSICLERIIEVKNSSDMSSVLDYAAMETGTILLLTNSSITKELLSRMHQPPKKYRMVLFPWNVDALKKINISSFVDDVIIVWPKPESTTQNDAMSGNPWFEGFQNLPGANSGADFFAVQERAESSLIVQAVNNLASQINRAYTGLCGASGAVCSSFTDFENIKAYIQTLPPTEGTKYEISRLKFASGILMAEKMGNIESDGDVRLILDGTVILPSASECTGWCPRCQQCQADSSPSFTPLYHPGDLLVAGVLPLSNSGQKGFTCGSLSNSLESEQMVEAFMFAVESYRTRYEHLLPNVTVGGLVIDSCSDVNAAVQRVVNFETCTTNIKPESGVPPHPDQTLGYVIHAERDEIQQLEQTIAAVNKLSVATGLNTNTRTMNSHLAAEYEASSEISATVHTLSYLNWTQVVLVISDTKTYRSKSNLFYEQASSKHICITKFLRFNGTVLSSLQYTTSQLTLTGFVPVVVIASKSDTAKLFEDNSITRVPRPWLLSTSGSDWSSRGEVPVPAGTIFVDRRGKLSSEFSDFYTRMTVDKNSSRWWQMYWEEKLRCSMENDGSRPKCPRSIPTRQSLPSQQATKIILSVDILLHAIHDQYVAKCGEKKGLCQRFGQTGISEIPATAKSVTFEFEDEVIKFTENGLLVSSYDLISVHKDGFVTAGSWNNGNLLVDMTKFYNKDGQLNSSSTRCSQTCVCLNDVAKSNTLSTFEAVYWETTGRFNGELWATIIVAIAAAGAFVTVILMFYVMYKVCTGALAKRYVGLGLLLLAGVMLLYLAVLPFVFTPSERVCALRYFAPGFTYCFCFATILVKMTSIRDYKLIGLGGEVSNLNQFMSVFFITSVQIAIGVQYWVLKGPFITEKEEGEKTVYACEFKRSEFLFYLVYVMFVLVLSSIYGISVRKEQKNMGEARLLLTSSWLCCVLWVAWILVLFFLDISLMEPIISAGIMACATVMLTVIFIPKMHLVARLKYNVSKQSHFMQNGHKVDPDFMFERPYSLPGTLTSSYSSVKTYPRSIEHFDSSLSY